MCRWRFEMMCDDDLGLDKAKLAQVMKISPQEAENVFIIFESIKVIVI